MYDNTEMIPIKEKVVLQTNVQIFVLNNSTNTFVIRINDEDEHTIPTYMFNNKVIEVFVKDYKNKKENEGI